MFQTSFSVFAVVLSFHLSAVASAVTIRTVALTGTSAPGGGIFSQLGGSVINAHGETAFTGAIGSTNGDVYGVWSEAGGSLKSIVKVLDPAPGTGGVHGGFSDPVITDNNQTLFVSSIAGVSPHISTLWYANDRELRLSVPIQSDAPGVPGAQLDSLQVPVFNSVGHVAFEAYLKGTGTNYLNNRGIWAGPIESPQLTVRVGDFVPGIEESKFQLLSRPELNNLGNIVFESSYGPSDTTSRSGIFVSRGGQAELIVSTGTEAPGTDGAIFSSRVGRKLAFNDNGNIAFSGYLDGIGVTNENRDGIWLFHEDTNSLIVRSGETAPTTDGAVFGEYGSTVAFGSPVLNNAGQILFSARLNGPDVTYLTSDSIWLYSDSDLSLIVRAGDTAPGSGGRNFWGFLGPWINEAGQIAFAATLTPTPDEYFGRHGIWVSDSTSNLKLIALEGDLFDVNDDPDIFDLRTIDYLAYLGGGVDAASFFNDAGQITFRAVFTDGTQGIFVANTSIPEPSTAILVTSIACFLTCNFHISRNGI